MERTNPFQVLYDICNKEDFALKISRIKDFPIIIDIELTNRCNLNCLMCPTGTGSIKRPQGFMSEAVYDKVMDELRGRNIGLRFIRWGEPFLHPSSVAYIEKAKRNGILCHVNTNGHLLNRSMMRRLVALPLDSIKFSFQGVDAESYHAMRQGNGDFQSLIEKIKELCILRGDATLPFIHVASTITYESQEKVAAFKEMMDPFADFISVGRTKMEHISVEDSGLDVKAKETIREMQARQSLVKVHLKQCPEVFDKLSINWDGTVTACCSDYDGKMIVGDLKDATLEEIWNGKALHHIRKILGARDYDKLELCRTCYDCMGLQSDSNKVV